MIPPGTDLSYSWGQALSDLGQISPIVAVTGFFLLAIVTDLVLPRSRRGGAVAMVAVVGFAYSLGTIAYRWAFATGGYAYHRFATGDNFALFFELLFASLGILTVALSHSYLKRRGLLESEFHILVMAAVIGMMVLGSATSLVTVFLGLELLSISLYIMCGFARADFRSQEAAAKYLLVGGFASAFVLYGMALIYGGAGTTVIPDIAQRLGSSSATNPLILLGIVLMGVGFAFKVSAAPFHMWTPDVYQGAPIPVTAFPVNEQSSTKTLALAAAMPNTPPAVADDLLLENTMLDALTVAASPMLNTPRVRVRVTFLPDRGMSAFFQASAPGWNVFTDRSAVYPGSVAPSAVS